MRCLPALFAAGLLASTACSSAREPLSGPPAAPRAVGGGEEPVLAGRACATSDDCRWWQDPDPNIVCCGGQCINVARDPRNCGACGALCADGQVCAAGTCSEAGPTCGPSRCPARELCCGGACVIPTWGSDCGGCGLSCRFGGASCMSGHCCASTPDAATTPSCDPSTACPAWQVRCNEACTDITTDPTNCGGCARTCPPDLPHCIAGICNP